MIFDVVCLGLCFYSCRIFFFGVLKHHTIFSTVVDAFYYLIFFHELYLFGFMSYKPKRI